MKKSVAVIVLFIAMMLSGCSSNTQSFEQSASKTSKNEKTVTDLEKEVSDYISDGKMYQAIDVLDQAKEQSDDDAKIEATLDQIKDYQEAEDLVEQGNYDKAKNRLESIQKSSEGLAAIKDTASKLEDEVIKKEESAKKEAQADIEKKNDEATDKQSSRSDAQSSNRTSGVGHIGEEAQAAINNKMIAWCQRQAPKGGMTTSYEGLGTPRYATDETYYVDTPDGSFTYGDVGEPDFVVGGITFYTSAGHQTTHNAYGIKDAAYGTIIDRYIWCSNGKIYEQKERFTKGNEDVANLDYSLVTNTQFQNSQDSAAISEYQSLIQAYC